MILSILIGRYRRKMSSGSRLKRKSDVNMVTFDIHEKREYLNSVSHPDESEWFRFETLYTIRGIPKKKYKWWNSGK